MSIKITDEELLDEMKMIIEKLGRVPKQRELETHSKYSCNAYKRAFGGINNAIKKLGERPFMDKISKEETIERLKKAFKENPNISNTEELYKATNVTYTAIKYRFNNLPLHKIFEECEIPNTIISKFNKQDISNDELKDEIIRLKTLYNNRYPTYYDMIREGKFSAGTYEQRFGTWVNAMKTLGFDDYINQSVFENQIHTIAKDNCSYKSMFEARVADLLYQFKIDEFIIDYFYEVKICETKSWTCDFVIILLDNSKLYLEADGMLDHRKDSYNGGNNEKINYYINNNLNYKIIEYTKTATNIETTLKQLLLS